MGTSGAATQILITQNTGRLCINGNFPCVCVAVHAKHVYSEWDLTETVKRAAAGENLDVNQRLILTLDQSHVVLRILQTPHEKWRNGVISASWGDRLIYCLNFNKNPDTDARLVPSWLSHGAAGHSPSAKEELPSKGGDARSREWQQQLFLSIDIDSIKGFFSTALTSAVSIELPMTSTHVRFQFQLSTRWAFRNSRALRSPLTAHLSFWST